MNDKALIYVAGNPDLYPLEYYDPQSGTYQGAIPAFLEQFAQEYGYQLRYYQPGEDDRRADLSNNRQVDLVSGCVEGESFRRTRGEPVLLFPAQQDGEETAYLLYFTQAAPEQLQSDLREYAAQAPQAAWTGALLEAAGERPQPVLSPGKAVGIGILLVLLLVGLLLLLRRRNQDRRAQRARLTDPETGLGTLELLEHRFPQMVNDQNRPLYYLIYFHLDLDHLGYLAGWEQASLFLRHGAKVLRQLAGPDDLLIRENSGLVILRSAQRELDVENWANRVLQEIRSFPFSGGLLRRRDAAVGICPLNTEYRSLEQALFHARQCALTARRQRVDCRFCGTQNCQVCQERWQLVADFRQGLEREEFQFCLQFFVDAHTFRVVGGEALSRWKHPKRGLLNPSRYIPLLEQEGNIEELDFYNLEKTCAFLEELDQCGVEDFSISCNFSRRTLSTSHFAERCTRVIQRHPFQRKRLILEVTESERIDQREEAQMLQNIIAIRELGAQIIFDDFGMGFSSFHDLQEYPMDGLKLDKQLVDNMWTERGRIILTALVQTGHSMGLTILAEGVENDQQLEMLQNLHCDVFQGFHFSIPLPAQEAKSQILARGGQKTVD